MRVLGISALSHDAALAVVEDGDIRFAAHAERYSRRKNDPLLNRPILDEALAYGVPDRIAWYERPVLKKLRHLVAGQLGDVLDRDDNPRRYLASLGLGGIPLTYVDHHRSHAAAGILTSGFSDAAYLVADAIGEFDTFTGGRYVDRRIEPLRAVRYPHSLGLLYSAFTRRCGFKPNEEEYILMGMAAYGEPRYVAEIYEEFVVPRDFGFRLRHNVHRGIGDWLPRARETDLAASIQVVTEQLMLASAKWLRSNVDSSRLVLGGGVALNCVANARIAYEAGFDEVWIFPNPGDAGSAVGAAAALMDAPLHWPGPYLGTDITGELDVRGVVESLLAGRVVGVARGRAEFGPRALGNRSLLCDPRLPDAKDRVNKIKGRELFRPFAPAVLADRVSEYFEAIPSASPYMQFVMKCTHPGELPAIVHKDGTSRVQTVAREDNAAFWEVLREFDRRTDCPMVLNTSLNIKGEPLVNDRNDAARFAATSDVDVF